MADASPPQDHAEPEPLLARESGRVVSIDILRGLAIFWVMTFHLYVDLTLKLSGAAPLYVAFGDRVGEHRVMASLTALGEVILGQGYMGVALFMMLSGLSLTMNAYRRPEPGILQGYIARFRRLVVAYWGGVAILVSTVAVIALLQMFIDGGSYAHQWWNVRIGEIQPVRIEWDDVAWALSVFGWPFRTKVNTVPVGSLWFVQLLLQYYLIFPFALVVLKKIGPWNFAAAGLAVTLVARAILVHYAKGSMEDVYVFRYVESFAPFRGSEFYLGISMGYLLVHRRQAMREWVTSPVDVLGLTVIAVLLLWGGTEFAPNSDELFVFGDVMVSLGLAIIVLPLLFKLPGRLEVSLLAKALVFLGVISFMALVVDDGMRYVSSFLRYEGYAHGPGWWFFLWVVYIPGGALIAYPLTKLFGLLPRQPALVTVAEPVAAGSAADKYQPPPDDRRRKPPALDSGEPPSVSLT